MNLIYWVLIANLNWKTHLNVIGTKISRIIGLLHKLTYLFPKNVLHSIYNSLIMPHLKYSLLAWGTKSNKIELLQLRAIKVLYSKSPSAHTRTSLYKHETTQVIRSIHLQSLETIYRYIEIGCHLILVTFYRNSVSSTIC